MSHLFQRLALEAELTRTLVALVSLYIITQLPTASYAVYRLFLKYEETRICGSMFRFLTSTADAMTIINSSVNFLIYYPSAVTFRTSLHELVRQISLRTIKTGSRKAMSTRSSYISLQLKTSSSNS